MDDRRTISDKQRLAILLIEKNLPGIKFDGNTRQEATRFIGDHMQRSMVIGDHRQRSMDVHNKRMIAAGRSTGKMSKPQQQASPDNEFYLEVVGKPVDSLLEEKILVMPDMSIAYSNEEWE